MDSELQKGAGHKYKRRIVNSSPPPKYTYIYNETSTRHAKTPQVGEKVKIQHEGSEGHFQILKIEGDTVTVKHDESGKTKTVSKKLFFELYVQQNRDIIKHRILELRSKVWQLEGKDPSNGRRLPAAEVALFQERNPTYKMMLGKRQKQLKELETVFGSEFRPLSGIADWGSRMEMIGFGIDEVQNTVDKFDDVKTEEQLSKWLGTMTEAYAKFRDLAVFGALADSRKTTMYTDDNRAHPEIKVNRKTADKKYLVAQKATETTSGILFAEVFGAYEDGTLLKNKQEMKVKLKQAINKMGLTASEAVQEHSKLANRQMVSQLMKEKPITTSLNKGGVKFHMHYDRQNEKKKTDEFVRDAVTKMEGEISRIKKAGLGKALTDLQVHMRFGSQQSYNRERGRKMGKGVLGYYLQRSGQQLVKDKDGRYKRDAAGDVVKVSTGDSFNKDGGQGHITLFADGYRQDVTSDVFTHEAGHRFYYQALSPNARLEWEKEINARAVRLDWATSNEAKKVINEVTDKQADQIKESMDAETKAAFIAARTTDEQEKAAEQVADKFWERVNKGKGERVGMVLDALTKLAKDSKDTSRAKQYEAIRSNVQGYAERAARNGFNVDLPQLAALVSNIQRRGRCNTEFISLYGGTNASEAFAEAFETYVKHGPRTLGPWTRNMFERVTRKQLLRSIEERIDENSLRKSEVPMGPPVNLSRVFSPQFVASFKPTDVNPFTMSDKNSLVLAPHHVLRGLNMSKSESMALTQILSGAPGQDRASFIRALYAHISKSRMDGTAAKIITGRASKLWSHMNSSKYRRLNKAINEMLDLAESDDRLSKSTGTNAHIESIRSLVERLGNENQQKRIASLLAEIEIVGSFTIGGADGTL